MNFPQVMFTRIHDDGCSVHERDSRNEVQYQWNTSQLPFFRHDSDTFSQIYRQNRAGREQDIEVENRLRNLNRVNASCGPYEQGVQAEIEAMAPVNYQLECLDSALKPSYTRMSRSANHTFTYENPNRADPGWYAFYTPPGGGNAFPGRGLYTFDRTSVDTRQAAKDAIAAPTKEQQILGVRGRPNPHAVPLLPKGCSHFGLFPQK